MSASDLQRILVVDDEAEMVDYLVEMLGGEGFAVQGARSGAEALAQLERANVDLVVTDLEMPEMRGLELLDAIQACRPGLLVIIMTAFGSVERAVQAVRAGACDFVSKPFPIEVLVLAINRALRERHMRREIVRLRSAVPNLAAGQLVTRSPRMRDVVELARRAAATDSTVLLVGESGAGKGAVARFIHDESRRAAGPFVAVNCAALPAPLVESELFGVRKGAFTDASADRAGLFIQATSGTVFLDEIAELPVESQPKLLHVLESERVRPLGADRDAVIDVRLIAATNRPLEEALRDRRFRPDLYYRLNVIRIEIPPLRERPEDIEGLVDAFLERFNARLGRSIGGVSRDVMRWLLTYDWPGNVRELSNVIERAVALAEHDVIVLEDVLSAVPPGRGGEFLADAVARETPLAVVEQEYIRRVLAATNGNKARAARVLGIHRRTLHRKLDGSAID
jgi:DNA-binding NtrC family response regulator